MEYKMVPIESFTNKSEVIEICKLLGTGRLPQNAAQAAAWHFTDGMSWEQLAQKIGYDPLIGPSQPYFSAVEIRGGMQIAAEVMRRVQAKAAYGEKSDSLSQK
jgi:hypothetical protein